MTNILHFTLGPVQGFIGQARRTRDWWAGSFLLGWLSGRAMRAVAEGFPFVKGRPYGEIDFPRVSDNAFYEALCGRRPDAKVYIATLPNRFRAKIHQPRAFRDDDPCARAVRNGWAILAEAVWTRFVAGAARTNGCETEAIWQRQVGLFDIDGHVINDTAGFFEIAWVLGESDSPETDGTWLDRRKNWRSHGRPAEPGDHCRVMGDLQELSGFVRGRGPSARLRQDLFWEEVRERVRQSIGGTKDRDYKLLELGVSERLSAPALVKRLFPLLPEKELVDILSWLPDGAIEPKLRDNGSGRVRYWPSTAHVAAAPWMWQAWQDDAARCREFATLVGGLAPVPGTAEWHSRIPGLEAAGAFGALDGGFFLEDKLETDIGNARKAKDEAQRLRLHAQVGDRDRLDGVISRAGREEMRNVEALNAYRAFHRDILRARQHPRAGPLTHRQQRFDDPPPFYALLVMDGDRAGELIRELGGGPVSQALDAFTAEVVEGGLVANRDGVLIYAGGDDVKALLTLPKAIPCALDLHRAYLDAFATIDRKDHRPTISAGLVFAAHDVPLSSVVRRAQELLKNEAKTGNGRNSMAVAVVKASGEAFSYVSRFARTRAEDGVESGALDKIMDLAIAYSGEVERSTSFLYNVKGRWGEVFNPKAGPALFAAGSDELAALLQAEWLKGRDPTRMKPERRAAEEARLADLLAVCRTRHGDDTTSFRIEGGLLATFLAANGVGWDQEPSATDARAPEDAG